MTTEAYTLWLRLYDARMADWKTNEEQLAKVAAIIEADREEVAEQAALKELNRILAIANKKLDDLECSFSCMDGGDPVADAHFRGIVFLRSLLEELEP